MKQETITPTRPVVEVPAKQEGIFDHRTHIRDANTGRMVGYQPYARHAFDDQVLLERPIGSGNMFSPNGDPLGRWERDKSQAGHWIKIAEGHTPTAPAPATKQEALEQENESLKLELEAIRGQLNSAASSTAIESKEPTKTQRKN